MRMSFALRRKIMRVNRALRPFAEKAMSIMSYPHKHPLAQFQIAYGRAPLFGLAIYAAGSGCYQAWQHFVG